MSDLADRLVQRVAEQHLRRYESEYDTKSMSWHDFAGEAKGDVAAVLWGLAALFPASHSVSKARLRELAAEIEGGRE